MLQNSATKQFMPLPYINYDFTEMFSKRTLFN